MPFRGASRAACVGAFAFIGLELFFQHNHVHSTVLICQHTAQQHPSFFKSATLVNAGVLLGFLALAIVKVFEHTANDDFDKIHCVGFSVLLFSILSILLSMIEWGGLCVDVFNVSYPAALWADWIVALPLQVWAALSSLGSKVPFSTGAFFMSSVSFSIFARNDLFVFLFLSLLFIHNLNWNHS